MGRTADPPELAKHAIIMTTKLIGATHGLKDGTLGAALLREIYED